MGAKFDIGDGDQVGKWLDTGFEEAAARAMVAVAARLVNHIVTQVIPQLQPRAPVDKGLYRAAWKHKKIKGGAQVWNSAPHAAFIEYGVRAANVKPGKAMIDALESWVMRKGIASKGQARGVAFAIASKMQHRGIFGPKGLRVLEKALERADDFVQEEYAREVKRSFPG